MRDELGVEADARIAVVGMACRLPGARDPEEFWRNLAAGVDSVTRYPVQATPDGEYVPAGGFVADPEWFDAGYFGYSPREARLIDPQHRVFLECAVEALERAGCDPDRHRGAIGVYAGAGDTDYAVTLRARRDQLPAVTDWEIRVATGVDFLTSRVAYKLGLTGPTVTVRAACATSLVAVHLAIQGLLAGDCDLALAGGVTIQVPAAPTPYAEGGIISPDGMCRTFDAAAKGIVGGQGACIVVLKRLPEAWADGDPIHAVLLGSAINNDGADRVGYTAPSVEGQAAVIRAAQVVAGVKPETITYVEAHGTATPIGDPIEVTALTRAFGEETDRRGYCAIGSVKTNIGHTDTAAGCAGLIKTVLAVERGLIPASLHFERSNPQIDFAVSPFRVATEPTAWRPEIGVRRAGVSSFGMGGTNAHVIVEEPPVRSPSPRSGRWHLLVLSARTPEALDAVTERLADHLRRNPDIPLEDVAWTLQIGRREHAHRRYAVVCGPEDAVRVLAGPERHRLISSGHGVSPDADRPGDADAIRPGEADTIGSGDADTLGSGGVDTIGSGDADPIRLAAVGNRWLSGASIAWTDLHQGERRLRVTLPTYPFERQRHIVEPDKPHEHGEEARTAAVPEERPEVRETVLGLFTEMLGLDELDPDDSFFDLGGDSLVATQLLVRLRKIFPMEIGLRSMFEAPTANTFAALVEGRLAR